jgi:hypothetical protein
MGNKYLSAVLIIALCLVICMPAEAKNTIGVSNGTVAGAVAGIAAGVVVIAIVAIHYSKKRSITGCVASTGTRMTITDDKDKQIYALSGDTASLKPGERVKLKGKKAKDTSSSTTLAWEARGVSKDLGVCRP